MKLSKAVEVIGKMAESDKSLYRFGFDQEQEEAMITMVKAATLLLEVHEDADSGMLDGVDLEWLVAVDALILGDDDE